jgi:hypothetical protein
MPRLAGGCTITDYRMRPLIGPGVRECPSTLQGDATRFEFESRPESYSENMSDLMPGEDGFDDTRGWDRASIAFRSRKPYVPDVSREDLLLPNEAGKLRTLALCSICAFGLTILFVGFPLLALGIFAPLGLWYPALLGGAFLGLAVMLFLVSTHETRQLRRLANER